MTKKYTPITQAVVMSAFVEALEPFLSKPGWRIKGRGRLYGLLIAMDELQVTPLALLAVLEARKLIERNAAFEGKLRQSIRGQKVE